MVYHKTSLIKFAALLLTAAAITPAVNELTERGFAVAQSFGENPDGFPIPSSLPDESSLEIDGSTSMRVTNEDLESRFESQYPDVDVEHDASRTDEAIEALLEGNIDLVASGRPLTEEEAEQGLVAIDLQREKLAILLGEGNAFDGNLTFEQFAQIFRGEITNWSEVGGPDLAIRFVDRPEYSDTRRALSTYEVFQGQPFETGETAAPVSEDETAAVIEALGNDGIGYAVFSQVEDAEGVQILSMHGTLPDDPRYPYSQYRAYVYSEEASPAALAFLGFATSTPGEEVITEIPEEADAATAEAEVDPDVATTEEPDEAATTEAEVEGAVTAEAEAEAGEPEAPDGTATAEAEAEAEEETALVPDAAGSDVEGGFPWWLLLLGIPLFGGLLWWLLKSLGGGAAATAPAAVPVAAPAARDPRIVLTPRSCRDAYAYWEIPDDRLDEAKQQSGDTLKVRLYDVTGRAKDAAMPPHAAEFDCVEAEPDLHFPIERDNHDYRAEVGYLTQSDRRWIPLAKSEPVRVPACPAPTPETSGGTQVSLDNRGAGLGGAAIAGLAGAGMAGVAGAAGLAAAGRRAAPQPRMVLTPRSHEDVYGYWEIPESTFDELKRQGGDKRIVRLYDVTDLAEDADLSTPTVQFDCTGNDPDLHMPVAASDRDYQAEVGYLTTDERWLPAVKSNRVHVPAKPEPTLMTGTGITVPDVDINLPNVTTGAGAIGAVAASTATGLAGAAHVPEVDSPSSITLTPLGSQAVYAQWDIPDAKHEAVKNQGGQVQKVRLYDVTNRLPQAPLPVSTAEFDCTGDTPTLEMPVANRDRDYVAEVGYVTADNRWLGIAKSNRARVPGNTGTISIAETSDETVTPSTDEVPVETSGGTSTASFPGAAIAAAAAAGAGALGAAAIGAGQRLTDTSADAGEVAAVAPPENRVILTPRTDKKAYVYWEVSEASKATLKAEGGEDYQIRVYDVTDIDFSQQPAHSMLTYDVAETERDRFVPLPSIDRDFIAEVGYRTEDGGWRELARSAHVRPRSVLEESFDGGGQSFPEGIARGSAEGVDGTVEGVMQALDDEATDIALAGASLIQGADASEPSTAVSPTENHIVLTPRTDKKAYAYWEISEASKATAKASGGQDYQLRIYDVTDIDLAQQPAHSMLSYDVAETDRDRFVPLPSIDRDFIAEVGYRTGEDGWLAIARSVHVRPRIVLEQNPNGRSQGFVEETAGAISAAGTGVMGAAAIAVSSQPAQRDCAIQTVVVHSRHNAVALNEGQVQHLKNAVAVRHSLEPGLHILRIREGAFNYDSDDAHPGEPFVLLWIYGGRVLNQKTGVSVNSTWSTLNGYADTLTLTVEEPAHVHAFFFDTFPDDNVGEVTLSVIKLS